MMRASVNVPTASTETPPNHGLKQTRLSLRSTHAA